MDRSDAALAKIISLVQSWDTEDAWETKDDWRKLREVRRRLEEGGKRDWASHPPWEEERTTRMTDAFENLNLQANQQQRYMAGGRASLPVRQQNPERYWNGYRAPDLE